MGLWDGAAGWMDNGPADLGRDGAGAQWCSPEPTPDGNDGPAWSRKREDYRPPPQGSPCPYPTGPHAAVPYAELHPTRVQLTAPAPRRNWWRKPPGWTVAIALTDHDGLYGVGAARRGGAGTVHTHRFRCRTVVGRYRLDRGARSARTASAGARPRPEGYRRLSRQLAAAHLKGGEKAYAL